MIGLQFQDSFLTVKRNGKEIFRITVGEPLMSVSQGQNRYRMFHGSFRIREKNGKKEVLCVKEIRKTDSGAELFLTRGSVKVKVEGDRITFTPEGLSEYRKMYLMLPSEETEHFYGGGEIFTEFDLKGKKLEVWVAEHINVLQTVKKLVKMTFGGKNTKKKQRFSSYETYYAQPTFISSRKYFFHAVLDARTVFDFRKAQRACIQVDRITPVVFGFSDDFESLMTNLTEYLGRQPELPDWVYDGQILGIQGGTEVMMQKYRKVKEADGKVCGIWIQDWEGRRVTAVGKQLYWNWEWDRELYPELPEKIRELNAEGVRVLGYCNPFLAVEKPLYKEASEKGYLVKDHEGKDYYVKITTFPAAMVDLTNPDAYRWLKEIIQTNMIDLGLSGWMADFAEYLPTDCVLASGEDPEYVHNSWPARWARLNREAIRERGKEGEIMFFTRAGSSGTPKETTMMWNGDNHPDFSIDFGLPSVIPAMLSLTTVGMGLSHSDIGGYTTIRNLRRNQEVYERWFEMNAFSLLMRGHEGLNPDLNIQFDDNPDILRHAAKMGRVHAALKQYLKEAVRTNHETGVGVIRPLFFYYDEEAAYRECYEYLLGRDILVCPVLTEGAREMEVYLPDEQWIHLYSGKVYTGGRHRVACSIGETPVFFRKGTQETVFLELQKIIKE